jgi:hypothetical protein
MRPLEIEDLQRATTRITDPDQVARNAKASWTAELTRPGTRPPDVAPPRSVETEDTDALWARLQNQQLVSKHRDVLDAGKTGSQRVCTTVARDFVEAQQGRRRR